MQIPTWAVVLVFILLLLAFSNQLIYLINSTKNSIVSMITGKDPSNYDYEILDDDDVEKLQDDPKANSVNTYQPGASDTLLALGYTGGDLPWEEVIQVSELDPA